MRQALASSLFYRWGIWGWERLGTCPRSQRWQVVYLGSTQEFENSDVTKSLWGWNEILPDTCYSFTHLPDIYELAGTLLGTRGIAVSPVAYLPASWGTDNKEVSKLIKWFPWNFHWGNKTKVMKWKMFWRRRDGERKSLLKGVDMSRDLSENRMQSWDDQGGRTFQEEGRTSAKALRWEQDQRVWGISKPMRWSEVRVIGTAARGPGHLASPEKESRLYSKCNGQPSEGFKQRGDLIWFPFLENLAGYCVGNGLGRRQAWKQGDPWVALEGPGKRWCHWTRVMIEQIDKGEWIWDIFWR